jgi:hypothetical protein
VPVLLARHPAFRRLLVTVTSPSSSCRPTVTVALPSAVTKGAASSTSRAELWRLGIVRVGTIMIMRSHDANLRLRPSPLAGETSGPAGLKPTKPAVQISDADRGRKLLINHRQMHQDLSSRHGARDRGEFVRVDQCKCIQSCRSLWLSIIIISNLIHASVRKHQGYENEDRADLKQPEETCNLSDLKHAMQCPSLRVCRTSI